MKITALIFALAMTYTHIKGIKYLFKSPKRVYDDVLKSIDELDGLEYSERNIAKAVLIISYTIAFVFVLLYYIFTATAIGTNFMVLFALVMILLMAKGTNRIYNIVINNERDVKVGVFTKIDQLLGIVYLTTFYILLFF